MPSLTTTMADLRRLGPLLDIDLGVSQPAEQALKKAGSAVPAPIRIKAMIDTGASGTVIQQGLATQLGLQPIGVVAVSTPSCHGVSCPVYAVQLFLPAAVTCSAKAIEAPLPGQNIQCLIGRDVLSIGVLIYIGRANTFTLSF